MFATFLAEAIAHPDDLATRRAMADWLMEQPDSASQERGEFIAIQLELASPFVKGARRLTLAARERELLERHRLTWEQPLRQTQIPLRCTFRRGLVEGLEADAVGFALEAADSGLFELAPITELTLRNLDPDTSQVLATSSVLAQIRTLTLPGPAVVPAILGPLLSHPDSLGGLRTLVLDGNPLGREGCALLACWPGLRQLRELSLRRCDLDGTAVRTLLLSEHLDPDRGAVALRHLDLRQNRRFRFDSARALLGSLAADTQVAISPRRIELAQRLLLALANRVSPFDFEGMAIEQGAQGGTVLYAGLQSASKEIRQIAARNIWRVAPDLDALPLLIRRHFEPGIDGAVKNAIRGIQSRAPSLVGSWLETLLRSSDPIQSLEAAFRHASLRLPPAVVDAFVALCRRRAAWRASHGRAGRPPLLPEKVVEPHQMRVVVEAVGRMAEDAAVRHRSPERGSSDVSLTRALARARECAWLASGLIRLLVEHERTRPRS